IDLASAIAMQDNTTVARAPGVGPKLAARIVAELKDKAPAFGAVDPAIVRLSGEESEGAPSAARDAISALVNLGYGRPQAAAAVAESLKQLGDGAEAGALIRQGLRELAR
ncbi:MAG: helix-hairpin-helix domain-containing protein, partial [Methylocystis sp.]